MASAWLGFHPGGPAKYNFSNRSASQLGKRHPKAMRKKSQVRNILHTQNWRGCILHIKNTVINKIIEHLITKCFRYQTPPHKMVNNRSNYRHSAESSTSPTSPRFIDVIKLTHSELIASALTFPVSNPFSSPSQCCCRFGNDREWVPEIGTSTVWKEIVVTIGEFRPGNVSDLPLDKNPANDVDSAAFPSTRVLLQESIAQWMNTWININLSEIIKLSLVINNVQRIVIQHFTV